MYIKASDFVLEIGPGGFPHWRADIVADKFSPDDKGVDRTQFGNADLQIGDKPFFLIKDNFLPFKDKSIDYTICSHVLEHVPTDELALLLKEIFRVSKKAYFEFPTLLYEWNYNFDVHTNLMDIVDGGIVCLSKKKSDLGIKSPLSAEIFQLRIRNKFAIETAYPELCATGAEFSKMPELVVAENDKEFVELIKPKYEKKQFQSLPEKPWFYREKLDRLIWNMKKTSRRKYMSKKVKGIFYENR